MFRHGSIAIAPAAALAAWLGCAVSGSASAPADLRDPASRALIVLPGAREIHRSSQQGARGVRYRLDVEFPAARPIEDVLKRLERLGFFPLTEDPRNSWAATSLLRGWTSFADASGAASTRTYSWWAEWTNLGGDHVSYGFRYDAPEHGARPLRSLEVAAGFYPAPLARQLREEAARSAELFAKSHSGPAREEHRGRTMLPARAGDAFLVSGPAGEAVVRITGTPGGGDQVAYRWRFRTPAGSETSGSVAESATLAAGPFRLFWLPRSPFVSASAANSASGSPSQNERESAVGYLSGVDVIPIPGEQFDRLDLGQVHALATLVPDRNQKLAAAASSVSTEVDVRREAIREAGKSTTLDSGRALLIQGPEGTGVIEILQPGAQWVKYRWRFRAASSSADASGEANSAERPFPELHVGPYLLQWQPRAISADATAGGGTGWSADVKYLPEELSTATIPAADAPRIDLAAVSTLRVSP